MCNQPLQGSAGILLALVHPEHSFVFYDKFLQFSVSWLSPATGMALCARQPENGSLEIFQSHDRWELLEKHPTGGTTPRIFRVTERSPVELSSRCQYSQPAFYRNSVQLPPTPLLSQFSTTYLYFSELLSK